MLDRYNRKINYLRISVTDRCNFRCTYCMPAEGVKLISHEDLLTFEEIRDFTVIATDMGIEKVRITGGEPLVRRGIEDLVLMLSRIEKIKDLSMTTNGVFLNKYAKILKKNGLHRLNVSLDTMNPGRFREITRVGRLEDVLTGLKAAKDAGFETIKINCVINKNSDEPDAREVRKFAEDNGFIIRYIRQMDLCMGQFWIVEGGEGGNCAICSKLRLTSDGFVKPCLFNEMQFSIRELGMREAIVEAINKKPHHGTLNSTGNFNKIGG